jgi:hypothetical protein
MKTITTLRVVAIAAVTCLGASAAATKTYPHASAYTIGLLDETVRVRTGVDETLASTTTDAKLGPGGQSIHILHTDAGD